MGGVLCLRKQAAWMPAKWAFDNALEGIAAEVAPADEALSRMLLGATSSRGMQYLDLEAVAPIQMRLLLDAVLEYREKKLLEGAASWHEPSFYSGYMDRIGELVDLLRDDPRITSGTGEGSGSGPPKDFLRALAETVVWCTPRIDLSKPKECFRSPELFPRCPSHESTSGSKIVHEDGCEWPGRQRHDELVARRRAALTSQGTVVDVGILGETRGRLLLTNPAKSLNDGGTPHGTHGLFDDWDVPAWDLWVQDLGTLPPRGTGKVPPLHETPRILVSWIPEQFVDLVETGAMPWDCYGFMCWADEDPALVPDEGDWRPFLPKWLTGLRPPIRT